MKYLTKAKLQAVLTDRSSVQSAIRAAAALDRASGDQVSAPNLRHLIGQFEGRDESNDNSDWLTEMVERESFIAVLKDGSVLATHPTEPHRCYVVYDGGDGERLWRIYDESDPEYW